MIGGNPNSPKYDFVIGNPPYMKIPKDAPEATAMPEVCYGVKEVILSKSLFECEEVMVTFSGVWFIFFTLMIIVSCKTSSLSNTLFLLTNK